MSAAPNEIVRLEAGTIDVDVAPLHAGERFRVIVGDAEVEVRGTSFEVTPMAIASCPSTCATARSRCAAAR